MEQLLDIEGDHELLVGGNHEYLDLGVVCRYDARIVRAELVFLGFPPIAAISFTLTSTEQYPAQ